MNPVTAVRVKALEFGGGVRLVWSNPTDATFAKVVILRKTTNTFTGPTDPNAMVVYEGPGALATEYPQKWTINPSQPAVASTRREVLDDSVLQWATTYYYAIYATDSGKTVYSVGVVVAVTIPDISAFEEVDVVGVLVSYLDTYYKRQVVLQALRLRPNQTKVEIHEASPLLTKVMLPCLSIHVDADETSGAALGDKIGNANALGDPFVNRRGYLCQQTYAISAYTDNPEVRRSLYRMTKAALIAVRQVLERLGAQNLTLTGQYAEDFINYEMPMYRADFRLTATLRTGVREVPVEPVIDEIDVHPPVMVATALA
jgi:hypothetical protein